MDEKFATNPSGMVIYHPPGKKVRIGRLLIVEFGTSSAVAIFVVLLAQTRICSFGRVIYLRCRILARSRPTFRIELVWFPVRTAAYMLIQIVGFASVSSLFVLRKPLPR